MTDDKTMTVEEARRAFEDAEMSLASDGYGEAAEKLRCAVDTLSAALQARDAEVAAYADETKTLREELQDAEDEITQLERESEGRRVALLEKAEEARREWQRAEQAEAECARLREELRKARVCVAAYPTHDPMVHTGLVFDRAGALARIDALLSAEVNPHVEPVGINAGGETLTAYMTQAEYDRVTGKSTPPGHEERDDG